VHLMTNTAVTGATFDIDGGQQLVEGCAGRYGCVLKTQVPPQMTDPHHGPSPRPDQGLGDGAESTPWRKAQPANPGGSCPINPVNIPSRVRIRGLRRLRAMPERACHFASFLITARDTRSGSRVSTCSGERRDLKHQSRESLDSTQFRCRPRWCFTGDQTAPAGRPRPR
jgi:hypothetical protein